MPVARWAFKTSSEMLLAFISMSFGEIVEAMDLLASTNQSQQLPDQGAFVRSSLGLPTAEQVPICRAGYRHRRPSTSKRMARSRQTLAELCLLLPDGDARPEPHTILLRRVIVFVLADGEQEILYLVRLPSPLVPASGKRIMTEHWSRLHGSGLAQYRHSTYLAQPPAGFNES